MILHITLPWPPANVNTNNQWRGSGAHVYQRPESLAYKNTIAVLTRQALQAWGGPFPVDRELAVTLRQYRPNMRRRDVDSNVKIVLDGLAVGFGIDDKAFTTLTATIDDPPDKANPRIDVTIETKGET